MSVNGIGPTSGYSEIPPRRPPSGGDIAGGAEFGDNGPRRSENSGNRMGPADRDYLDRLRSLSADDQAREFIANKNNPNRLALFYQLDASQIAAVASAVLRIMEQMGAIELAELQQSPDFCLFMIIFGVDTRRLMRQLLGLPNDDDNTDETGEHLDIIG